MDHYPEWEETVLEQCYDSVDYLSMHHYHSAPPGDIKALLGGSLYYEEFIDTEVALCDVIAAKRRSPKKIMLSFDEYGAMIRPNAELHPGYGVYNMTRAHYRFDPDRKYVLHDPDQMLDRRHPGGDMLQMLAMVSIQMAFLRHADRVKIACMTGGLGALCSSDHDHVWRSASYYALSQLMEYARGTSMQTSVECETYDMPGYAIDDTSQYRGKENVPYVDSASAWDRENGRLNLFVLNRNEESEYSLTVDVRGFEGYRFVKQFEMYTDDLEAQSSFDNPSLVLPKEKEDVVFTDGRLTTSLKPLSWNVLCFEKEEE